MHEGHATVAVHMPTSWCAANFAYMMAEEIRQALLAVESIHGGPLVGALVQIDGRISVSTENVFV